MRNYPYGLLICCGNNTARRFRNEWLQKILWEQVKGDDQNGAEVLQVNLWGKIISHIENCDEVLLGEPERIRFKTPEEITAL